MANISPPENKPTGIGTLQEMALHAALKAWYARPGDQVEAVVDGCVIDVVREGLLVEIQTRNFAAMKGKLARLLENHPLRLVHPIAQEKWIVRLDEKGEQVSRRKSPRRGCPEHLFLELVRIPGLVAHPNFSIEVLLTQEEELWMNDGKGSWRRKRWSIHDRRLLGVVSSLLLASPQDYRAFLPPDLLPPFTARRLAAALGQPLYLAQKMAYCLRIIGVIEVVGHQGKAYLYGVADRSNTGKY